jgi:hypothetical protein
MLHIKIVKFKEEKWRNQEQGGKGKEENIKK